MKNLNVFVKISHNGYGNTEYNVNWDLISACNVANIYNFYFSEAELPEDDENLFIVSNYKTTGCINPQSETIIYLHKVNSIITDIYREVWRRTHLGSSITVDKWSNLGGEGSQSIFNEIGFKTPIDSLYVNQEYWEKIEIEETEKWAAIYAAQDEDEE